MTMPSAARSCPDIRVDDQSVDSSPVITTNTGTRLIFTAVSGVQMFKYRHCSENFSPRESIFCSSNVSNCGHIGLNSRA